MFRMASLTSEFTGFYDIVFVTVIIMKQNGHSKGPFSAILGIGGTRSFSISAVDDANDVCEIPVLDMASSSRTETVGSKPLDLISVGIEEATVLCTLCKYPDSIPWESFK